MRELLLVLVIAAITFFLRAFPFLLLNQTEKLPSIVSKLEKQLPSAIMILLVIYCVRTVSFASVVQWLPSVIGIIVTILVHVVKRNVLLSILSATLCYMILLRML